MYTFFKNFHSGFRYVVFLFIVVAIITAVVGWLGKKPYTEANRKTNLFAMISAHTQLLLGLILYFVSPLVQFNAGAMKNPVTRYFTAEHITMMLVALLLITIGHSRSKKATTAEGKHKSIAIFYILGVIVIVGALTAGHLPLFGSSN